MVDKPHFSEVFNLRSNDFVHPTYKQRLFIDIRDVLDQVSKNLNLSFNIILSNSSTQKGINVPTYDQCSQAEILAVNLPKISNELYFVLDIDEFQNSFHSTNDGIHDKFATLFFDDLPDGSSKPLKGSDFAAKISKFNPIKQSLNKLQIKFRKYGGNIISPFDINPNYPAINTLSSLTLDQRISFLRQFFTQHPVFLLLEFTLKQ